MKTAKRLKKKAFFVNEAIKVFNKYGLKGFSARKVATESGYNVASIYTYFKNLDHLKNLASAYFTTGYIKELSESANKLNDPLKVYLSMWMVFLKQAYKKPDYYYNVFFQATTQTGELNLFKEYYSLFPEEKPGGDIIAQMVDVPRTIDREAYVMGRCIKANIIKKTHARHVLDMYLAYIKSILSDIVRDNLYEPSVKLFQRNIRNLVYTLYNYVGDEYIELLDDIIDFYSVERSDYDNYFDQK